MSTIQGAVGGSGAAQDYGPRDWASAQWRGRSCGVGRWSVFEIVAMVLGFIVFWPIGLAILGFKLWQRKAGYPGDLQTAAQEKWREARSAMWSGPWQGRHSFYSPSSGNSAFDDWRANEIARLEEERRKLQDAHREFQAFVDNIRKAKDREEFERFMNERRNRPADGAPGQGPGA
ncbi:MAG TPA: DUF2852 domain-containing protein [Roseiarcus sp.]|jgi:hypothetical protein